MVEAQKKVKDKSWWYCNTHSAVVLGVLTPISKSRFNHHLSDKNLTVQTDLEEMRRATWEVPRKTSPSEMKMKKS